MKFLVTSYKECVELEANDIQNSLELGMKVLNQHPFGNVSAVVKPNSEMEAKELYRKLIISTGEFDESFGYPDYESKKIKEYVKEKWNLK